MKTFVFNLAGIVFIENQEAQDLTTSLTCVMERRSAIFY